MKQNGLNIPGCLRCVTKEGLDFGSPFDVIWKREGFDVLIGLAINGMYAGRLVAGGHYGHDVPIVDVHRTLATDGAYFSPEEGLEHLYNLDISPYHRRELEKELTGFDLDYPRLMSRIIKWLGYPIDKKLFTDNVISAHIYGKPDIHHAAS